MKARFKRDRMLLDLKLLVQKLKKLMPNPEKDFLKIDETKRIITSFDQHIKEGEGQVFLSLHTKFNVIVLTIYVLQKLRCVRAIRE